MDEKTQEAINAKITAQQDTETQEINNQTAINKAKADAEVTRAEAQAEVKAFDCDNVGLSLHSSKMPMIVEAEDSDFKTIVLPVAIK